MARIEFQVCEPEDLFWVGTNKTTSVLRVLDHDGNEISRYDSLNAPSEGCIREMMLLARDKSCPTKLDPPSMVRETLILQDRITVSSGATKTFLVANYVDGELEEYCRPKWRRGTRVNCRLF